MSIASTQGMNPKDSKTNKQPELPNDKEPPPQRHPSTDKREGEFAEVGEQVQKRQT